jgi:uncharacterized protein YukE
MEEDPPIIREAKKKVSAESLELEDHYNAVTDLHALTGVYLALKDVWCGNAESPFHNQQDEMVWNADESVWPAIMIAFARSAIFYSGPGGLSDIEKEWMKTLIKSTCGEE